MSACPLRILIVDDDERALIELEHLLETEGYSTVTAWSGREGLALSRKMQFDLILIDEQLADIEAATFLDTISHTQPGAVPLLVHSCSNRRRPAATEAVCKWEPGEVTARIRSFLAA